MYHIIFCVRAKSTIRGTLVKGLKFEIVNREVLAIKFAIGKFHKGRHFILVTDNVPQRHILDAKKGLPVPAAARIQHWSVIVSGYTFNIEHRKSEFLCSVDALSRSPVWNVLCDSAVDINPFNDVTITPEDVSLAIKTDPVLSLPLDITRIGKFHHCSEEPLKHYFNIPVHVRCWMYSNRITMPITLQAKVLNMLHEGTQVYLGQSY